MDLGLANKRALVTGASRGLGKAIAKGLRAEGAAVAICAREPDRVETAARELGAIGLVSDLSREVAGDGVTVNAIMPGYTATERLREPGIDDAEVASQIPAGRLGRPEEFAAPATFLASERAAYICGQAIACDGGFLHSI